MKKWLITLGAVAVLSLSACSSSDKTETSSGTTAGGSATTAEAITDGSSSGTDQVPACENNLQLVNAAASTDVALEDRELDVVTAWADEGPHPANTVDYDKALEVAIAEYEIPKDPQFGYSIPTGNPGAPDGKFYLSFRLNLTDGDQIEAGQSFFGSTPSPDADGTVISYMAHSGSDSVLMGDAKINITSIDDDKVCGSIESVTKTDLQTFPGIEGTFELDRIQALEAAEG